ncbi:MULTISPECIES: hypothetical protein [unclassified Paraburkholderia]|uniref:hypothetical protein n=1 Tax=unclassified Paraburkholderia TaxID=2615204 RepID=UPI000E26E9FF|nr:MULTISPECIES: hypothetical protein [unclassified Paraburkholderia]REE22620.1 hypothetical protein B0G71_5837 [Paraburkholderia sp. BL27I4N3]RKR36815.1 hypothetical protein B0G82_4865 [Paraburkholderia sp. BL17N1]
MMPPLLIPVGRWKVHAESTSEQASVHLSGRALSGSLISDLRQHEVQLTPDQAHELISGLNLALLELELQRTADLARRAEGAE